MTLPTWTPDFTSGRANSAWWTRGTNPTNVCATQGMTLFKRLQRALNTAGVQAPRRGATTDSAIGVDGDVGYQTLTALNRYALQIAADEPNAGYETLAATILADRDNNRTLSRSTLLFAIWVATGEVDDWNNVVVSSNAILPRAGVAPANDGSGGDSSSLMISCWTDTGSTPVPVQQGPATSSSAGTGLAPSSSASPAVQSTGLGAWWDRRTTGEKVAMGLGGAGALYYAFGRKKRRGKKAA